VSREELPLTFQNFVDTFYTVTTGKKKNQTKKPLRITQLEIRTRHTVSCWAPGHALTLTFDFLTPKFDALLLVPKCINAQSLVKMSYTFQDTTVLTTIGMHRHEQPENTVGGGIKF